MMTQICPNFDIQRHLWHGRAQIIENVQVAEETFRLRFSAPELLKSFTPGQFVMLRLADSDDPLLGRPLAVYRADRDSGEIDVVYIAVGKMTKKLSHLVQGTELMVFGPLGNGFQLPGMEHLIMVAGGIGQTPFFLLAEQSRQRFRSTTLLFGAKTRTKLACVEDFRKTGIDVRIATEDGSEGTAGYVTDLLDDLLSKAPFNPINTVIVGCGPKKMLETVFLLARKHGNFPCQVSLESPMACGLGICFSCAVRCLNDDGTEDYLRTCVDGPVFDAYRLKW